MMLMVTTILLLQFIRHLALRDISQALSKYFIHFMKQGSLCPFYKTKTGTKVGFTAGTQT